MSKRWPVYMEGLVAKGQKDLGEDMLGMLVREHGDELDADALANIAGLLLTARHKMTANMLGIGTLALLQHPEQLEWLRANSDQIGPAVEELLRFLSVAHSGIPRVTKEEVRLGDQTIPARSQVQFGLAAANRETRGSSTTRTGLISPANPPRTSPSGTARTTAWVRRSRGWR